MAKKKADADPPSPQVKAAAEKIYELADAKGWTIRTLAQKAGKPFQTFNNWKKGHTTAQIEKLEAFARVVDATVLLCVKTPEELQAGGFTNMKTGTFVIARMVDDMSDEDREYWRKLIAEYVEMRRNSRPPAGVLPLKPPAGDPAPLGRRKTGTRK